MKIPDRVRYINKRFTNRLMGLIAGKRGSPIALLHHIGRVSGKWYATPIISVPMDGSFLFALTYGDHVDWYRNILSSGSAELTWRGNRYELTGVTKVAKEVGRSYFPFPFRRILKWMDTEGFISMHLVKRV